MRFTLIITTLLLIACVDVSERPVIMVSMAQDSSYTITFTDRVEGLNKTSLGNVLFQLGQSTNQALADKAKTLFQEETGQTHMQALLAARFRPFNGQWLLNDDTVSVAQGLIEINDTTRASLAIMDDNSIVIQPFRDSKALLTKAGESSWRGTAAGELVEFVKIK